LPWAASRCLSRVIFSRRRDERGASDLPSKQKFKTPAATGKFVAFPAVVGRQHTLIRFATVIGSVEPHSVGAYGVASWEHHPVGIELELRDLGGGQKAVILLGGLFGARKRNSR
jgi:hypothetical protein